MDRRDDLVKLPQKSRAGKLRKQRPGSRPDAAGKGGRPQRAGKDMTAEDDPPRYKTRELKSK